MPSRRLYHGNGASQDYDPFGQLTAFARGVLSDSNGDGIPDTVSTATRAQSWTLDGLGNWGLFSTTAGSTTTTQARSHNQQNQLTAIDGVPLVYDNNGDLIQNDTGKVYRYDAWNRLVQVSAAGGVVVSYAYDALGRRDQETRTGGANPVTRQYYYSDDWQVLEERDGGGQVLAQNVWSPVYVDALVERDQGGQCYYVQQDANGNVTAITDASGNVRERYALDPYGGSAVVLTASWGQIPASLYSWVYLHQGGRYDGETGLYDFRNRFYDPEKGRWLNLDPMGFDAGDSNLYRYEGNEPTTATDPSGLGSLKETPLPKGLIQLNYWRAFLFRGPAQDIGGDKGVFVGVYDPNTGKVKRGSWIVDYAKVKESAESLLSGPITDAEWAEWFASHAENRYQDLPEKWVFGPGLTASSDRYLNRPGFDADRRDAVKQGKAICEGYVYIASSVPSLASVSVVRMPAGLLPAGQAGTVVRNKLTAEEFRFAEEIVALRGGTFVGNTAKKAPGIDGMLGAIPSSLKQTQGKSPVAVLHHASQAEAEAKAAGYKAVEVFIEARNIAAEVLLDFGRKGGLVQIPFQGTVRQISVLTRDGWVIFPGK